MTFIFERPTLVPQILTYLRVAGVEFHALLQQLEKEVNRPLSANEGRQMRQRLKGWSFRDAEQVPWWYPAFAWRGIALTHFNPDWRAVSDIVKRMQTYRTRCPEFHYRYRQQRQLLAEPVDNHSNKWRPCTCNCNCFGRKPEMGWAVPRMRAERRQRREVLARASGKTSAVLLSLDDYTTE